MELDCYIQGASRGIYHTLGYDKGYHTLRSKKRVITGFLVFCCLIIQGFISQKMCFSQQIFVVEIETPHTHFECSYTFGKHDHKSTRILLWQAFF